MSSDSNRICLEAVVFRYFRVINFESELKNSYDVSASFEKQDDASYFLILSSHRPVVIKSVNRYVEQKIESLVRSSFKLSNFSQINAIDSKTFTEGLAKRKILAGWIFDSSLETVEICSATLEEVEKASEAFKNIYNKYLSAENKKPQADPVLPKSVYQPPATLPKPKADPVLPMSGYQPPATLLKPKADPVLPNPGYQPPATLPKPKADPVLPKSGYQPPATLPEPKADPVLPNPGYQPPATLPKPKADSVLPKSGYQPPATLPKPKAYPVLSKSDYQPPVTLPKPKKLANSDTSRAPQPSQQSPDKPEIRLSVEERPTTPIRSRVLDLQKAFASDAFSLSEPTIHGNVSESAQPCDQLHPLTKSEFLQKLKLALPKQLNKPSSSKQACQSPESSEKQLSIPSGQKDYLAPEDGRQPLNPKHNVIVHNEHLSDNKNKPKADLGLQTISLLPPATLPKPGKSTTSHTEKTFQSSQPSYITTGFPSALPEFPLALPQPINKSSADKLVSQHPGSSEKLQSINVSHDEHILRYLATADICQQLNQECNVQAAINIGKGQLTIYGNDCDLHEAETMLNELITTLSCEQVSFPSNIMRQLKPQAIRLQFDECRLVVGSSLKEGVLWLCSNSEDNIKKAKSEIQEMLDNNQMISQKVAISVERLRYFKYTGSDKAIMEDFSVNIQIASKFSSIKVIGLKTRVPEAVQRLHEVTNHYVVKCCKKEKIFINCLKMMKSSKINKALSSKLVGWKRADAELLICGDSYFQLDEAEKVFNDLVTLSRYPVNRDLSFVELLDLTNSSDWIELKEKLMKDNVHLEISCNTSKVDFAYPSCREELVIIAQLDNFFQSISSKECTLNSLSTDVEALCLLNKRGVEEMCQRPDNEKVTINIKNQKVVLTSQSEDSLTYAKSCIENLQLWKRDFPVHSALVGWLQTRVGEKRVKEIAATHFMLAKLKPKDADEARFKLKSCNGCISKMMVSLCVCEKDGKSMCL